MFFKKLTIAFSAMFLLILIPISSALAAEACNDATFREVANVVDQVISNKVAEVIAGDCSKIPEVWSLYTRGMAAINEAGTQAGCRKIGSDDSRSKIEKELEKACPSGNKKPSSSKKPLCKTPPSPATMRKSPTYACFIARNTNSDEHCDYSFSYIRGQKKFGGGNVAPGQSQEICSLQVGVDIQFEKWTKSSVNAK